MPRPLSLLLGLALVLGISSAQAGPSREARLGEDGLPVLEVVVASGASGELRQTAEELADHLGRIIGTRPRVQEGDGSRGIVLGTLAQFSDPALAEGLAIRDTYDGREAYAIRTESGRVRLIGATELGASHAAFRFLEHLGCRWFFPAPEWEIIPRSPDLTVMLDVTERPALLSRRIWYGSGFFDPQAQQEYDAWRRHNRQAASLAIQAGHAWQAIIRDHAAEFERHPEYRALVQGKRQGEQLCVSNPEVRRIASLWALEQLRRHPERDMVSMECSDGNGQCECEPCQALGSLSDRIFGLANEVARAVAGEFPGKLVGLYAYNEHCEPPSFDLEPNVYVQSTSGFIRGRYTFDELVERWPQRCKNVGFYDYFSVWDWDHGVPPGGRGADTPLLRVQIPRYADAGATSVDAESGNNWGLCGRGYYLANRLMWDPHADADALLADFHERAFGPAAKIMKRYYDRLDRGSEPLIGEPLLALALRDLEEAARLAGEHPDVLARLDQLKQYQHFVRLRWELDHEDDADRKRERTLAVVTYAYRTRRSYMEHWRAIEQVWLPRVAREFDQPTWSPRHPSAEKPWKVETTVTRAETERDFRDDLTRFPLQPVEEIAFSSELVPAGLHTEKPAEGRQMFQGKRRYALYSRQGEPVEISITTGVIVHYRDRPQAAYTVTDGSGQIIAQERLPQDGVEHVVSVPVSRPGMYVLAFNDQTAGWRVHTAGGQPCVLLPSRDPLSSHLGQMQRMYFYVPRGTRHIDYFSPKGATLFGPDGQVAHEMARGGVNAVVPVPEGADGTAWSCVSRNGQIWFFNVPSPLAASPDALLVPQEVAERDGLRPTGVREK